MMTNKQVKQVVKNFPYYLGECLVVNATTAEMFLVLRIEVLTERKKHYIDLVVDRKNNQFLGLGGTSDGIMEDFSFSINCCRTHALAAYLKEAF